MNVNFGFSYIGLIFLLMLMLPNIVWSKNKPKDYDKYVKKTYIYTIPPHDSVFHQGMFLESWKL